jgi:hypothetical protein
MKDLLNRFSWDSIKFNNEILVCLIVIWIAVLWCTISSISGQAFNRRQRLFWIGFIIGVPLIGVLAYLPFSFRAEDYPNVFFWRKGR